MSGERVRGGGARDEFGRDGRTWLLLEESRHNSERVSVGFGGFELLPGLRIEESFVS